MYSPYVEQAGAELRFLCEIDDELRVAAYATHWSNALVKPIVVVRQFEDGATTVVSTYKDGHQVPDITMPLGDGAWQQDAHAG